MASFLDLIRGRLDQNSDNSLDGGDVLAVIRKQVAKQINSNENDDTATRAAEMIVGTVAAAGMVRESSVSGTLLGNIFGNDDLIRGIVAILISNALRSQFGFTIPPKQLNNLIETVIDKIKRRKSKKSTPETSNPTSGTPAPEGTGTGQ